MAVEELEKTTAEFRKKEAEFSTLTPGKDALAPKLEGNENHAGKAVEETQTTKDASSDANLCARPRLLGLIT